jgi:hypothetical protein
MISFQHWLYFTQIFPSIFQDTEQVWVCCFLSTENEIIVIKKLNSVVVVRKRTIPTERPPLAGKVANLCG